MPPKKPQAKGTKKKKSETKCKYNNRGYCKLKEACENIHSDKVCDNLDCSEDEFEDRHPNPCKFGPRCQVNKRKECLYLHAALASNDENIEALKTNFSSKLNKLEN
jgi:hypothetical protein